MTHSAHIQTLRAQADGIIWQRFDVMLKSIKSKIGCPVAFERVITDYCKTSKQNEIGTQGNLDEMIAAKVDEAMRTSRNKADAAKKLGRSRWWLYDNLRRRGMLAATIFLASGIWCSAQRGEGTTFNVQRSTFNIQAAPLAPAPVRQTFLTWDNPPGASNRVAWGTIRNAWTNGVATISTNRFPITNGWHYNVTAIVNGIESIPGLWPSNRFDRIWIQTSTNLTDWKDGFIWKTNMNLPQEFLRIRAELIRWE